MKLSFYKKYGMSLIIIGSIIFMYTLIFGLTTSLVDVIVRISKHGFSGPNTTAVFMLRKLLFSLLVIVLAIMAPGVYYYKVSKRKKYVSWIT